MRWGRSDGAGDRGECMELEVVVTEKAPKAVGPYVQAVKANGFLFTAGQIGLDPATGTLVDGGIQAQTRRVLENLKAVVEAAGGALEQVVKTTVYLTDLGHFQAMNQIYAAYFQEHRPARSTVGVAQLPLGALVEIELVALLEKE
ncbi:MAG: RidA family protein [Candidatus Methylomirabilales bacterium]